MKIRKMNLHLQNFYLRPDKEHAVKLWLNDFDQNGSGEQFLTRRIEGKDMPVFLKREITDQYPGLKKQNLRHSDYAKKTIEELFGREVMAKSQVKEFNYCSSIVAINDGKGHFEIEPLPGMVQLSSVKAVTITDVNGDGRADLVLGGNLFTFPPQFGRLDGSYGQVLLNEGKGGWKWEEPKRSGISVRGEIKGIEVLGRSGAENNSKGYLLIVQNDQYPVLFKFN